MTNVLVAHYAGETTCGEIDGNLMMLLLHLIKNTIDESDASAEEKENQVKALCKTMTPLLLVDVATINVIDITLGSGITKFNELIMKHTNATQEMQEVGQFTLLLKSLSLP
jgi:hypothetical protein